MRSFSGQLLDEARESFIDGKYAEAETLLQQPTLQNSNNPEVFQMLATICYNRGQFNKAIKTFKKALAIDPTYTDAAVGLSIILNDLGKYDEAKKVFEEAQALIDRKKSVQIVANSNVLDEKFAIKHIELAHMYMQHKRFENAIEQFKQAQTLSQKKTEISLQMSDCYVEAGKSNLAVQILRSTLHVNNKLITPRLKLGLILYNSHMIAEAVDQWENILRLEPKNEEATRYLKMAQTAGITKGSTHETNQRWNDRIS
jgi:tetratricopeptide (TPR) repeat protein